MLHHLVCIIEWERSQITSALLWGAFRGRDSGLSIRPEHQVRSNAVLPSISTLNIIFKLELGLRLVITARQVNKPVFILTHAIYSLPLII